MSANHYEILGPEGFDAWAPQYDDDLAACDGKDEYPFAGYSRVQEGILSQALTRDSGEVLDLGLGTGLLSQRLAAAGFRVTGVDFSQEMLNLAARRLPDSRLIHADFSTGLPAELADTSFDLIISSYAFHHIPRERKRASLQELLEHLKPHGLILIGDIAFKNRALSEACRDNCAGSWDDTEDYLVYEELTPFFREGQLNFTAYSFCAGVFSLQHP